MKKITSYLHISCCILALYGSNSASADMMDEPIKPVPLTVDLDAEKVKLGQRLFNDPRLSKNSQVSCATCHDLENGGDDGLPVSIGINGKKGEINSPTVFNSSFNFKQFWNGRADTLEEQINGPLQAENEMGAIWPGVVARLYEDSSYPQQFEKAFNDQISPKNIRFAIAEFERSLITPNSRFDQYLRGDLNAITKVEKEGYANFKKYGCVSCHQGQNVGGNMFQVFGVLNSYFEKRGSPITDADKGRYTETGRKEDKHVFKVPSLRMVAETAPYLHDGSAKTLRDAVDAMFEFQLGRNAPDKEKDSIVAFLKSLAGQYEEYSK